MKGQQKAKLLAISELALCNPFSPRRFELEAKILGTQCEPLDSIAWNRTREHSEIERPNVVALTNMAAELVETVTNSGQLPLELKDAYWNVATYYLLYRHITHLPAQEICTASRKHQQTVKTSWANFWIEYRRVFQIGNLFEVNEKSAAHLFACLSQVHRAFFNIFDYILGESLPISKLREKVWESIFTNNIRRYHDTLHDRMKDFSTLVTGPSGTGKELVARAIGLSQYVQFDVERCRFQCDVDGLFLALNLTALSPTLIESELFGHRKGAFTGAVSERVGWLESCSQHGAVFLDEIGELDVGLQVKLLRVLQQRTYCRLGETKQRTFAGKIIAATNRNLEDEIRSRRFREDFYFRICSDRIETPSLQQQLQDCPDDLSWLIQSIVRKQTSDNCGSIAEEMVIWIRENLGMDYHWPGNIRELEQCVRSFILRQSYVPLRMESASRLREMPAWLAPVYHRQLTAEQVLSRYCTWVYLSAGSYEETARQIKLDRRTVKSKIDESLLRGFAAENKSKQHDS